MERCLDAILMGLALIYHIISKTKQINKPKKIKMWLAATSNCEQIFVAISVCLNQVQKTNLWIFANPFIYFVNYSDDYQFSSRSI